MRTIFRFVVVSAVLLVIAFALIGYSGIYDVSVESGHSLPVEKTLAGVTVRSIRAHAQEVVRPTGIDLSSPGILEKAAGHFEAMCRTCHGAPGKKADPWLLYPPAPDLTETARKRVWTDAEVFWIIKHGIKDTAMGAFGGTHPGAHSDEDIWGLTTLIRQFWTLPPEQYRSMVERAQARHGVHDAKESTDHDDHDSQRDQKPKAS